jgi:hypothetical protein
VVVGHAGVLLKRQFGPAGIRPKHGQGHSERPVRVEASPGLPHHYLIPYDRRVDNVTVRALMSPPGEKRPFHLLVRYDMQREPAYV